MRKLNKLVVAMTLATVTLFSACSEKETPVPTVNNERLDALRTELRGLQLQVYGEEMSLADAEAKEADLERQIANVTAEIERLKSVYEREIDYGVYVIDFQNNKLAGATVKVAQNGEIVTATADENGYVLFDNLFSGAISGVIQAEGYTTANFRAGLYDDQNEGVEFTTSRVALLPTAGNANKTGMFTVTGNLYANYSTLNDTLNNTNGNKTPAGPDADRPSVNYDKVTEQKLTFNIVLQEQVEVERYYDFCDCWLTSYSWVSTSSSEAFQNISGVTYENAVYTATFSEDGSYTVSLPASGIFSSDSDGWDFTVDAQSFMADFTYNTVKDPVKEMRSFFFSEIENPFEETIHAGESRTMDLYYNTASKN